MKGLILDHNGVICDGRHFYEERCRRIAEILNIKSTKEALRFWKETYIEASLGKITLDDYYSRLSKEFNVKLNGNEDDLFINKEKLIEGIQEELKKLKQNKSIRICLLSNYVQRWIDKFLENNKIKKYFDSVVVSSSIGIRKPDERAYRIAAESINVPLRSCIYVGDSIVDLEVCKKLGIKPVFIPGEETSAKSFQSIKSIRELHKLLE